MLTGAFFFRNSDLFNSIDQDGDLVSFVNRLLKKLDSYGCFEGRHPAVLLLEELSTFEGPEVQSRISDLISELEPLCPQEVDAHQASRLSADARQTSVEFRDEGTSHRDEEQTYLAAIVKECQDRIRGYVSLSGTKRETGTSGTTVNVRTGASKAIIRHPMLYQTHSPSDGFLEPTEDVLETVLSSQKVVLLGEPGSGKTTTLLQMALDCAVGAQTNPKAPIPVFIPLTLFQGNISFHSFVQEQMPGVVHLLESCEDESKRLLLLFDALNETLQHVRDQVVTYLRALPRFVVSCRSKDYQQELISIDALTLVTILDLDPHRIKRALHLRLGRKGQNLWEAIDGSDQLLRFWDALVERGTQQQFWYLGKVPAYTTEEWDRAWIRMHERGILPLCRNPFMFTMVCDLYEHQGQIPANRGELFKSFINASIDSELARIANVEMWIADDERYASYKKLVLGALTSLAREIQLQKLGTGIGTVLAKATLERQWDKSQVELTLTLARDSGLISTDRDQILFSHQLIQEYFASEILGSAMDSDPPILASNFFNPECWWEPQGWEETAIILAGVRGRKEINKVIRWLADAQPELAVRAIEQCGIPGVTIASVDSSLREWLQKRWAPRICDEGEPIKARAVIGTAIGRIGDPRNGVGVRLVQGRPTPDIDWCGVPEKAYEISRFPITYLQFQSFVEANDGYSQSIWWDASEESRIWHARHPAAVESMFKDSNYPRVDVSWFEAIAFSAWLSDRLGEEIGLPDEAQWEYAACGSENNEYPWGVSFNAQHGNVESGNGEALGRISCVGVFPGGKAFCGAEDMFGNVWEWCNEIFPCSQSIQDKTILTQVSVGILKGGSWFYRPEFTKCKYRFWAFPTYFSKDVGFRVIRSI